MANYENLKNSIRSVIRENGANAITGNILQQTLVAMIGSLGAGYQFMGIATDIIVPGTPDYNVFYLAAPGLYPNFNGLRVPEGSIGILKYNGTWSVDSVAGGPFYTGETDPSAVLPGCKAFGENSVAEGHLTEANGDYSHAEGEGTRTTNQGEHAEGTYNYSYDAQGGERQFATLHSVGIGGSNSTRRNAVEVLANGEMFLHGAGGYDGTNMREGAGSSMKIKDGVNSLQSILNGMAPVLTDADMGPVPEELAEILGMAPAVLYNGGIKSRMSISDLTATGPGGYRVLDEITAAASNIRQILSVWGTLSYDVRTDNFECDGCVVLYFDGTVLRLLAL